MKPAPAHSVGGSDIWTLILAMLACGGAPAPASAQIPDSAARCAAVRAHQRRTIDSVLAIGPMNWRPDPRDDSLKAEVQNADVVIQVRVDTLGRPEINTFRPVRWREIKFIDLARQQLHNVTVDPFETLPGCRVPYLLTLPFRFSVGVRD